MSFRSKATEHFPLARSACLLFFAILTISFNADDEHDPFVGGCAVAFGALSIAAIVISPTERDP